MEYITATSHMVDVLFQEANNEWEFIKIAYYIKV